MAKKQLFVAEADKIQDLLFRSARQRQVGGGSRLLAKFGEQIKEKVKAYNGEPLIWRGGSFRIVFPENTNVDRFREELQNFYRLLFDSTITCAETLPFEESNKEEFQKVNDGLQTQLLRRKLTEKPAEDVAHAPTIAFCQDTGNGLARYYENLLPGEEAFPKYLSKPALDFGYAGGLGRYDDGDNFLAEIKAAMPNSSKWKDHKWPITVDEIGKLDPLHNNVAYLLADVNDMGNLFSKCQSPEALEALSNLVETTMKQALVKHLPTLYEKLEQRIERVRGTHKHEKEWLPMLPLIFAGDDAFVLLPALYALDYARRFCDEFQKMIHDALKKPAGQYVALKDLHGIMQRENIPYPTISAGVVFCKTKYPYHLAHQRGKALLNDAKRFAKRNGNGAIGFEIIIGNQLVKPASEQDAPFRPSLQPYWITKPVNVSGKQQSVSLEILLKHRLELKMIPGKRLAELREIFSPENLPADKKPESRNVWMQDLQSWRNRIKLIHEDLELDQKIKSALMELGIPKEDELWLIRKMESDNCYLHGLPDLIEVWDYAQDLNHDLIEYN
jgi:hypothetical protein